MSEPEDLVQIIADEGVGDLRLLEALRAVPRASFVPANLAGQAYQDKLLSIPHQQVTTQPSLVARIVEALALESSERVLEVGAGYTWQTALLARLCGFVWVVERFGDIAEVARDNLARFGVTNAKVVTGDGTKGLPASTLLTTPSWSRRLSSPFLGHLRSSSPREVDWYSL